LRIYNGRSSPVDVTLAFTGASVPEQGEDDRAGETLAVDNVLPTLWGITRRRGSRHDCGQFAARVTARTFSRR